MHDELYFSEQHLQVREMVRDFARNVVRPSARAYDLDSKFPWDNVKQMAELGLFGIPWPEALGGSGMDYLSYMIVIHEMAKVDASHAITISAHTTLGTSPIVDFGTPEQKKKYVPLLATGKVLGGFGLTEPGAGSDAGGTKTVAVEKGDHYVLNGSKIFITHAGVGEIFVATARTDPSAKKTHGITAFIVTKDTTDLAEAARVGIGHEASLAKVPGFSAGKKEDKLGWRASDTRELVFQDAIVPKENVLGPVNNGFRQFLHTLDGGRIGIAAPSLLGSPRARSRSVWRIRRRGSSSGSRSRASRASTSRSRTWLPRSSAPSTSCSTRHGSSSMATRSNAKPRWPSCTPRSSPCAPRRRRYSSTAGTATPPSTRWSG